MTPDSPEENAKNRGFFGVSGLFSGVKTARSAPPPSTAAVAMHSTTTHNSTSPWGGWVIRRGDRQFQFPGDTAFVAELFADIRKRVRPIDVVAMPIGAYASRES